MPVFLLTEDALHVQPLHPRVDRVSRFFAPLGFELFEQAWPAVARLDAKEAAALRGLIATDGSSIPPSEVLGLTRYCFRISDLRRIEVGARFPELAIEVRGPSGFRR